MPGPEAAPALPAIATVDAVVTFLVVLVLSVLWFQIIRKVAVRIAGLSIVHVHPFGWLSKPIGAVDRWIKAAQAGTERAVVWTFHETMLSVSKSYKLTRDLAEATYRFFTTVPHAQSGTRGAAEPRSIGPRLKTLEREYKGIDARLDHVERREQAKRGAGAAAGAQDFSKVNVRIRGLNDRVTKAERELHGIEHTLTHVGTRTGTKTGTKTATKPRVVSRERAPARHWTDILTKLGAASLVIAALGRIGLGWLRCPSLLRMGRKMGCAGFGWLEAFFAEAFTALVVLDLCRFALAAQKVARFIVPQLGAVLLVQNAVCLGGGASLPSAADRPKVLTTITRPSAHD